ncbi:MAG: hypothetical protein K5668_10615 [Lachnospiraceae bacterium]|nr:hypothetical protein [Lachnospiraceae bacterium]
MNRSQIRKLFDLLKYVRLRDLLRAWKLPVAALAALLYRRTHRNLWVVSEDENEARDNGFWFFRFVKEKHPEQECIYAIRRNSPDFEKVAALGDTVEYGSLRHWILYLSSSVQISRFLCGAYPEYEYIRKHFGYPEGHVRYTGLCRFDGLHHFETDPSLILIMPTWRNWLVIRKDKLRRIEQTEG